MGGGHRKKGSKKGDSTGAGDDPLWVAYARDITPLKGKVIPPVSAKEGERETSAKKAKIPVSIPAQNGHKSPAPRSSAEIDLRTETRLRRGQIPIDGRIDLHGHTQLQAEHAVSHFIQSAYARGARCLLVITGKGGTVKRDPYGDDLLVETGVLKRNLKGWLMRPPLDHIVLKVVPAAVRHGGSGAAYVYLRRHRDAGK